MIMEVCGIPPVEVIDESRKKDHYFDVDYSPYLIEDDSEGILRLPSSKTLEDVIPCDDLMFVDFIKQCLELDPVKRISAR
jgi:dual specificity tyrosine-phosphorylation-regulated kinase 2/3/4